MYTKFLLSQNVRKVNNIKEKEEERKSKILIDEFSSTSYSEASCSFPTTGYIIRRKKAIHGQPTNIKINLFNPPSLLNFPLVIMRPTVPVKRRHRCPAVSYVDAINVLIIFNHRLYACFPEYKAVSFRWLHLNKLVVLEFGK